MVTNPRKGTRSPAAAIVVKTTAVTALFMAAIAAPAAVHADVVRASYEGTVTAISGTGFGYAIGDPISGWFEFESADLEDESGNGTSLYSEAPVASSHESLLENAAPSDTTSIQHGESDQDMFYVVDGELEVGTRFAGSFHDLIAQNDADWFSLADLLSGNLVLEATSGATLAGAIVHYVFDFNTGENFQNQVNFDVDSLRFGAESESEPLTTEQQLSDLMSLIMTANIHAGVANALDSKLATVMHALEDNAGGNDGVALNAMYAFCHSVAAQRDKKLSGAEADQLAAAASEIIASINPYAPGCLAGD
jgi:hypothetical protein